MPVVLHIYPRIYHTDGTVAVSHKPEEVSWAVRCAIELGADVIKVPYTGDVQSFHDIIADCPVPVVAAGGPRTETLQDALKMTGEVVKSGARGVTAGRNVWGFSDVASAIRQFKRVIHENQDARTAAES
jgi:class I fructose-bisphosphate aldolase